MNKKTSLWERYLTREIGIEFKACLYFFAILVFYCIYRLVSGVSQADILHMGEMILLCYVLGYVQVYLFGNFDEAWRLGAREIAGLSVCTVIYTALSYVFEWFERDVPWTCGFFAYVIVLYVCVILVYRTKRRIDDKELNRELELFKARPDRDEDEAEEDLSEEDRG
ncbi:MAG: DUF3021 family protein [Lachnospiraceae bacterium]|nr:DUF3021 family protein [Lachnospiraceae bacterium]